MKQLDMIAAAFSPSKKGRSATSTPNQGHASSGAAPLIRSRAGSLAAAFVMVLAMPFALPTVAQAQNVSPYVVSSQIQLAGDGTAGFNGGKGNYAANSRGDFFVDDGNGHVLEYPASGGAAIVLWTDTSNYGSSGVAVDPFDNLYVTNFYGPGGNNGIDSQVYEFPFTNGTYPAPYVYNGGSPPGNCFPYTPVSPTNPVAFGPNTGVCAVGQYTGAAYYYWQPLNVAADGQGNTYMYSNYDNTYGSTSLGIFKCDVLCNEQQPGGSATAYTTKVANTITSMIADYAGDVYFTDQTNVYIIPAGSARAGNTPTVFDASYTTPYGVTLDKSGNLYVTDASGIWEVPAVETKSGAPCQGGADVCQLVTTAKYRVLPLTQTPTYSEVSPAIDNRGNIIFSPYYGGVYEASLWAGNFPSAQIGATGSSSLNFTIVFNKATTLSAFTAVQGSAPATEFNVSAGSCTTGTNFAAMSTCSFSATFTPSGLGVRTGAVLITDSNGHTTTTHLSGVGTGTGIAVDPGTPNAIGTAFQKPTGLAVDNSGNVYVADSTANKVLEYPAGAGAGISIGTNLSVPTGVAVDGAGNVFIVNQGIGNTPQLGTGTIVEVPILNGVLQNASQTTLATGLNTPTDIVADGDGNLFVSATGSNQVLQLANASRIGASAALIPYGYGLSAPTGLALDSSGNVYVADTGNNRVLELGDGFQTAVGNALSAPTGVAVDSSGSVMIADGTGRLLRVPNETYGTNAPGLNQADQQVLSNPLSYPYALRTDNSGNIYVSDSTAALVYQLQRTAGGVNFGNWNLNTVSDSQTIVVSNIGNATLTLGSPLFAPVPAASEFAVSIGTGSTACGAGNFPSGYNCTLLASFSPTVLGLKTYPLVLSAAGTNNAAPTIGLSGTGVNADAATIVLSQTAPTGKISYGQQLIISAKIAPAGSTPTPTGYVVFTFDGQNQRPLQLNAGAASITFNGLNAGPHTISAYYEGDSNYASLNSSNLTLNISLATSTNVLTIVGDSSTPLSVAPTHAIAFTDTLLPATTGLFTGSVVFLDTVSQKVLATVKLGSPDPKTGAYTAYFNYTPTSGGSLALGNYNIIAQYSGNTNYFANSSAQVPFVVIPPTFTLSPDSLSVTASANNPGIINITVTDYSNFQAGVSLSCSGLPANAYCVFRPGNAQLLPAPLITPLAVLPVPVVLQIQVDQSLVNVESASILWLGALAIGVLLVRFRKLGSKSLNVGSLLAVICLAGIASLTGCGSGSNSANATPPGVYPFTITATGTPLVNGSEPSCIYVSCTLPPDPVTNPSLNVVKTFNATVTVK